MKNYLSIMRGSQLPAKTLHNYLSANRAILRILPLFIIFLFSCARSYNPDIERGSGYLYRQGYPEMRISALGLFDKNGKPGINITADVVYGSLVFKNTDDTYQADVSMDISILDKENPDNIVNSRHYDFSIKKNDQSIVNSQEVFTFQKRIEVKPGDYKINVTITDRNSNKQTARSTFAYLPNPEDTKPNLTNIQMMGKSNDENNGDYFPITTYDVPGKIDSLKFIFQVTHNDPNTELTINTKLVDFKADTTPARPMSFNNYSPSTIQYKGIDYDEKTEIQSNRRVLTETGNILIEYVFPIQQRGDYRFDAEIEGSPGEEDQYKARDFSIKSKNYPSVKTARELARPLYYLMSKKEYNKMLSYNSPDSIKRAMDHFWLEHIGNAQTAKSVIKMYYERVEEANKQFSNFKEGWKTDLGYIYILFGPPWYVEQSLDIMKWSYSYNREDPRYNYLFQKPKMRSEFYPFDNYLLQRNQYYYNVEYQQRQLWLTGTILTRNI